LMILVTLPSERERIHGGETRMTSGWVIAPDTMVVPELEGQPRPPGAGSLAGSGDVRRTDSRGYVAPRRTWHAFARISSGPSNPRRCQIQPWNSLKSRPKTTSMPPSENVGSCPKIADRPSSSSNLGSSLAEPRIRPPGRSQRLRRSFLPTPFRLDQDNERTGKGHEVGTSVMRTRGGDL